MFCSGFLAASEGSEITAETDGSVSGEIMTSKRLHDNISVEKTDILDLMRTAGS